VSLLFGDLCRENPGLVGSDFRVVGIRDVNFITLRELIGSGLESGLEIFSFSALYLTVPPSSAN
jgi:hypothetical protein